MKRSIHSVSPCQRLMLNIVIAMSAVTPIQPQMTHLQPAELDISIDSSVGGNNDYQCWYFTMNNEITWRFTSHNFIRRAEYPPNLNCLKLITAPRGHYIRLTFEGTYGIEGATDCKYDWLTFQDGPFIFSKEIKKLCGNGGNNIVESTGRYMRLIFHTDDVIEEAGFNISFAYLPLPDYEANKQNYSECYFQVPYEGQGQVEISEEAISQFYKNMENLKDIDCVWDIYDVNRKENDRVWIWIEEVKQNTIRECGDRRIEIYGTSDRLYEDIESTSSKCYQVEKKFYPRSSRALFRVYTKQLHMMPTIIFNISTFTEPLPGHAHCETGTYTCEDGSLCLNMSLLCNGRYNCPDGDDESRRACELKNGHNIGLQFIFIGTALVFFTIVSLALIISARRAIYHHRKLEESRRGSTVIANSRPIRLLQPATVRVLLEPNHTSAGNGEALPARRQSCHYVNRCPNTLGGRRGSTYGRRGSWYLDRSISNLSVSSEPRPKRDASPVHNSDYLSPETPSSIELKRMRAAST